MTVDNQRDIDGILRVGRIVAYVRDAMLAAIEPGMTTGELDDMGAALLEREGAQSAPRVMYDFPGATCISVNEEAAHGIPGPRVMQPGDIVNVDVSAEFGGYFADTGGTVIVPPTTQLKTRLCHATQLALKNALAEAVPVRPSTGLAVRFSAPPKRITSKPSETLPGMALGGACMKSQRGLSATLIAPILVGSRRVRSLPLSRFFPLKARPLQKPMMAGPWLAIPITFLRNTSTPSL